MESCDDKTVEIRARARTLSKKMGNNDEEISCKEVIEFSQKIGLDMPEDQAIKIFNEVDKEKKGRVRKSAFVSHIGSCESDDNCKRLNKEFELITGSKCLKIISKLREIKHKAKHNKELDTVLDIDWIIETLIHEDIYEAECDFDSLSRLDSSEHKHYIGFLSNLQIQQSKADYINQVNKLKHKNATSSFKLQKKPTKAYILY